MQPYDQTYEEYRGFALEGTITDRSLDWFILVRIEPTRPGSPGLIPALLNTFPRSDSVGDAWRFMASLARCAVDEYLDGHKRG
ncbi:hypothetical protein [Paludibacterium yongneupense]|nr:hypothetical protein [Paludibacterium yongneupense]